MYSQQGGRRPSFRDMADLWCGPFRMNIRVEHSGHKTFRGNPACPCNRGSSTRAPFFHSASIGPALFGERLIT